MMGRRDFVLLWIQALLLALFPWLRTERGIEVAGKVAEAMVPAAEKALFKGGSFQISIGVKGYELSAEQWESLTNPALRIEAEPFTRLLDCEEKT